MKFSQPLLALVLLFGSLLAHAGVISLGGPAVASPDQIYDFESSLAPNQYALLTNQFSADGLTVTSAGTGPYGAQLHEVSNCLPSSFSYTGTGYVSVGVTNGCGTSGESDVSFHFDTVVSEMSFDMYTHGPAHQFHMYAYLDAVQVSYALISGPSATTSVLSVTGSAFNRFRIVEANPHDWLWMDQLAVSYGVPAPSALAFMLLALAGFGLRNQFGK